MGIPGNDQLLENARQALMNSDSGSDYFPNTEEQSAARESLERAEEVSGYAKCCPKCGREMRKRGYFFITYYCPSCD